MYIFSTQSNSCSRHRRFFIAKCVHVTNKIVTIKYFYWILIITRAPARGTIRIPVLALTTQLVPTRRRWCRKPQYSRTNKAKLSKLTLKFRMKLTTKVKIILTLEGYVCDAISINASKTRLEREEISQIFYYFSYFNHIELHWDFLPVLRYGFYAATEKLDVCTELQNSIVVVLVAEGRLILSACTEILYSTAHFEPATNELLVTILWLLDHSCDCYIFLSSFYVLATFLVCMASFIS